MPKGHNITTASDEQLITVTRQGDIASFGIIVERYWDMVIAFALSKIGNTVDAEDIAQESFLKAYSQLHNLRNPSRFAGWLCKITTQQ
ncbi:MAG: RNA polymerase sigma factor, partial [Planctomycetota bacterium]